MKWLFYLIVFLYMFYRAVYGVKPKEIYSLTIEPKLLHGEGEFLEAGTRKTINCKASHKNQKLEWVNPNGEVIKRLPTNRVFAKEHYVQSLKSRSPAIVLIFTHAIVEDSGIWQCRSGDLTENVSLCVIDPATFVETPSEVNMDQGRAITLSCQARGEPEPRLIWHRNGEDITDDGSSNKYSVMTKFNSQGFEGLLTITELEPDDSGLYTCEAIQESTQLDDCKHSETFNITLQVNYAPKFRHENDTEEVYGKNNESVDLVCEADGFPTPTYRWFKEISDILSEFPQNEIDLSEDGSKAKLTLKINETTFGQRFRCRASNKYGDTDKSFTILKLQKPMKPNEVGVYNATDDRIQLNVTWAEELVFPVDSVQIQYIKMESLVKKRVATPKEADWRKGDQVETELDDNDDVDPNFEGKFTTLSNLEEETEYWLRLRAVNNAGLSPWSDPVIVSTLSKEETEEGPTEEDSASSENIEQSYSDATFYGLFFAGGIAIISIVCMFAMRLV